MMALLLVPGVAPPVRADTRPRAPLPGRPGDPASTGCIPAAVEDEAFPAAGPLLAPPWATGAGPLVRARLPGLPAAQDLLRLADQVRSLRSQPGDSRATRDEPRPAGRLAVLRAESQALAEASRLAQDLASLGRDLERLGEWSRSDREVAEVAALRLEAYRREAAEEAERLATAFPGAIAAGPAGGAASLAPAPATAEAMSVAASLAVFEERVLPVLASQAQAAEQARAEGAAGFDLVVQTRSALVLARLEALGLRSRLDRLAPESPPASRLPPRVREPGT